MTERERLLIESISNHSGPGHQDRQFAELHALATVRLADAVELLAAQAASDDAGLQAADMCDNLNPAQGRAERYTLMKKLFAAFGERSQETMAVYLQSLEKVPWEWDGEVFRDMIEHAIQTQERLPSIVGLIRIAVLRIPRASPPRHAEDVQ